MEWFLYIIRCADSSLYTGITTDVQRRFNEHLSGRGAKYFRFHSAEEIIYVESGHSRSSAGKREIQIKRMTHAQKSLLASAAPSSGNA